jgi:YD repeat-containing protein
MGRTEINDYDERNRKKLTTDRIGAQTGFAYDLVSNLLSITDAEGRVTDYRYDARNLLDREAFPIGQAGRTVRFYTYDGGPIFTIRPIDC